MVFFFEMMIHNDSTPYPFASGPIDSGYKLFIDYKDDNSMKDKMLQKKYPNVKKCLIKIKDRKNIQNY